MNTSTKGTLVRQIEVALEINSGSAQFLGKLSNQELALLRDAIENVKTLARV